jgi:aspartate 1-decarboxylase
METGILYIPVMGLYIASALGPERRAGRLFMLVHLLKSKIHRAQVTAGDVNYEGSLGIARDLMDKVGLQPYERILCGNMANGERFETYAIAAEPGSGQIILNGATARLGKPGDRLTIMSFTEVEEREAKFWKPRVIVLGENNAVVGERGV